MSTLVRPCGPIPAKIMIIGEAPGADEERVGEPFVGVSGQELNRMLQEAGILRSECFLTNIARIRPLGNQIEQFIAVKKKDITPAHRLLRDKYVLQPILDGFEMLKTELESVKPQVIIPLGNLAMWALTGKWGVTKWRGSMLRTDSLISQTRSYRVIPTYHPAAVLRQWDWRSIAINDLRRAKRYRDEDYPIPGWNFIIRPSFAQAIAVLDKLYLRACHESIPLRLSFDLETRAGHTACAGISWTLKDAICIPLMCVENKEGYWQPAEEAEIVFRIYRLLTHKNVEVVGQNLLYDSQYTYRHWHFIPRVKQDTMISQHAIFSDLPKSLAFQASMYCNFYIYWKDEGKDWAKNMGEDQLWAYNCQDCVYTDEAGRAELATVKQLGLEPVHDFQQRLFWPVLQAMCRGVRIDKAKRNELINEVQNEIAEREQFLKDVLGHPLNPRSPLQMNKLFYTDLGQPVIMTRAKKGVPGHVTCDDEALQKIAAREPLLKPIINAISDMRTLGVFLSGFLTKPLDTDGRMRCSYNIGGSSTGKSAPKTYRLSSSENAFGSGTNLQNIPSEKSKSIGKAAARGHVAMLGDPYMFPNIRSMFVPDPGFTFLDMDLDRADLHVFVWEIDDELYKETLHKGVDSHLLHVYLLDGKEPPPLDELVETHPKYLEHRAPRKHKREFSKVFCHATDYVGSSRTIAAATGRTIHEIDRARKIYLGAHPTIEPYWKKIEEQVRRHRFVENRFGYRWYIFDRLEMVLPEAVAWIPQSTVSIVINKIWEKIYTNLPEAWILMQVHDSLSGQVPTHLKDYCIKRLKEEARVVVPYPDPLIIPIGISTSEKSWGDCK